MFERVVLGIDPGTAAAGVAVVVERRGRPPLVAQAETFRTDARSPEPERLRALFGRINDTIKQHRPVAVALERLLWGRNVGSGMSVARASGVILLAAGESGIPVHEYGPLEVKMAVTGDGRAKKEDVRRMLTRFLKIEGIPDEPDAADAVAVAICHLHQARVDLTEARR